MPREADCEAAILKLRTSYRVEQSALSVWLGEPIRGRLSVTVLGYRGHFPVRALGALECGYSGPCELKFDLRDGSVQIGQDVPGRIPVPLPGRRFCLQFRLVSSDGLVRSRMTGHYLPGGGEGVGANYFAGDNYVDYDEQSAGEWESIRSLMERHAATGPVLEVGCAVGHVLESLEQAGHSAVGIDVSQWAVDQVGALLGPDRAWACDVEREPLPPGVAGRGPFQTLLMWYVFEHFERPFEVLEMLAAHTAPGATLILGTTNADSLTHRLFDRDWEGHFDWTHHGVERVGVRSLREMLPQLGWRIETLTTERIWDGNPDPTCATLREWWAADARFRRLLTERDLGDLITCVAVRTS